MLCNLASSPFFRRSRSSQQAPPFLESQHPPHRISIQGSLSNLRYRACQRTQAAEAIHPFNLPLKGPSSSTVEVQCGR